MTVKRILILYSDTGGGHRSAGEAIAEALQARPGADVEVEMVDVLKHYTPYPFNRLPEGYPKIIQHGARAWGGGFRITNGPRRMRLIINVLWPYLRRGMKRFLREHSADAIIIVHPFLIVPVMRALGARRPPVVAVVTDLVSTHAWWYSPKVDVCIVPTELARVNALRCGLSADQVRVLGLPVAARFCAPSGNQAVLRAQLGWGNDRPIVLLVGGGDGMGPLGDIARAINASGLRCEMAVVAGRNQALRDELAAQTWSVPTHLYGFVTNMPDLMRAADVLVTKAGPGTVSEALNVGLPMLLYGHIPGQEVGNLQYVTQEGAGVSAPGAAHVVAALRNWIGPEADPQALTRAADHARRLARPQAAADIAELIATLAR